MLVDTGVGLVAAVILFAILLGQHVVDSSIDAMKLAVIIVTNTIYETLLVVLLGFFFKI
jgi:hypothetical protein